MKLLLCLRPLLLSTTYEIPTTYKSDYTLFLRTSLLPASLCNKPLLQGTISFFPDAEALSGQDSSVRASYTLITSPLSWYVQLHENSADVWTGVKCGTQYFDWHHLLGFEYFIQSVMQSAAVSSLGCKLLNPLKAVDFLRDRYLTKCFLSFPYVCALKYYPVIIYSYTCEK